MRQRSDFGYANMLHLTDSLMVGSITLSQNQLKYLLKINLNKKVLHLFQISFNKKLYIYFKCFGDTKKTFL